MSEKAQKLAGIDLSDASEQELVAELARRRAGAGHRTITEMEDAIEQSQMSDGAVTLGTFLREETARQKEKAPCPKCGQAMGVRARDRARAVRSMSGAQTVLRNYHYCSCCKRGFYPLDAQLGLAEEGELTPKLRGRVMDFAINSPYSEAAERWNVHYRVPVCEHLFRTTVERTSQAWSGQSIQAQQSALRPPVAGPSGLVVVQTDGSMLPMRGEEPWKEAKVGVVYREEHHLASNDNAGRRGQLTEARYVAAIGAGEFDKRLRIALRLEGVKQANRVAWIGDGAHCIWTQAHRLCPQAVQILDWTHAVEHAVEVAKVIFGPEDLCIELWKSRVEHLLGKGEIRLLLAELSDCWRADRREGVRKALHDLLRYYRNNRKRMDYRCFRELGLPIGSGTVESAHRHVLQKRMKLAGQHWDLAHARHMVRLRAAYKTAGPPRFCQLVQTLAA